MNIREEALALVRDLLEADVQSWQLDKDKPLITRCTWCRRLKQPDGSYAPGEPEHRNVSDGVCPDCFNKMTGGRRLQRPNPPTAP